MKKVVFALIAITVLLTGCMQVVIPLTPQPSLFVTATQSVQPTATPFPSVQPLIGVRLSATDGNDIYFETANQATFVYLDADEAPLIKDGSKAEGFLPVPDDGIITGTDCRNIVIAAVDGSGTMLRATVYPFIPGIRYYGYELAVPDSKDNLPLANPADDLTQTTEQPSSTEAPDDDSSEEEPAAAVETPQGLALFKTVMNSFKDSFRFGYGEPLSQYMQFSEVLQAYNAGFNLYCREGQPLYSPVTGTIIRVSDRTSYNEIAIYIDSLDATFILLHASDNTAAAELLKSGGAVNAGDFIGRAGSTGGTVSGTPEIHMELVTGKGGIIYSSADPAVLRHSTYDVRVLFDNGEALISEDEETCVPVSYNVGGNAGIGIATAENGWIYYLNAKDSDRIYKMRLDGSDQQKVCSDKGKYLAVCEGWLYYSNVSKSLRFYKIRVDGTERTEVLAASLRNFTVVGDTLYFSHIQRRERLCTMTLDGNDLVFVNAARTISLFYYNGAVYGCVIGDDSRVHVTSINDEGVMEFNRLKSVKAGNLIFVGDKIYYTNYNDASNSIYRMDPNGENQEKISDISAEVLNYHGGKLYFVNVSDNGRVYVMGLNGEEPAPISTEEYCKDVCVAGDWLYYNVQVSGKTICYRYSLANGETVKIN